MAMGLAEAAAGISGHESGHLQKSAGQQVKLSIHLLHVLADNSVHADAFIQNASLLLGSKGFTGYVYVLGYVYDWESLYVPTYRLSQSNPILICVCQ